MRTINLLNNLRHRTNAQSVRSRLSEPPVLDDKSQSETWRDWVWTTESARPGINWDVSMMLLKIGAQGTPRGERDLALVDRAARAIRRLAAHVFSVNDARTRKYP